MARETNNQTHKYNMRFFPRVQSRRFFVSVAFIYSFSSFDCWFAGWWCSCVCLLLRWWMIRWWDDGLWFSCARSRVLSFFSIFSLVGITNYDFSFCWFCVYILRFTIMIICFLFFSRFCFRVHEFYCACMLTILCCCTLGMGIHKTPLTLLVVVEQLKLNSRLIATIRYNCSGSARER